MAYCHRLKCRAYASIDRKSQGYDAQRPHLGQKAFGTTGSECPRCRPAQMRPGENRVGTLKLRAASIDTKSLGPYPSIPTFHHNPPKPSAAPHPTRGSNSPVVSPCPLTLLSTCNTHLKQPCHKWGCPVDTPRTCSTRVGHTSSTCSEVWRTAT